ncbi:uncharacterized protein [Channa argus]|uniref:uncharacterized protein isoform X4 n=1 Tax=Channa argus TaxID=215402 RepID=UPI0035206952
MCEFRWINMFSFVVTIQLTEAAFGQQSFISVGLGDDAALPCADLRNNQGQCQYMTWIFSNTMKKKVTFFKNGNFKNARSGRLSVTENCSLVIKKVTVEDGGVYTCRLSDKSRPRQGPGEQFVLSVITATTAAAEATTSAVATELATTTKASNTSSKLQALALFFLLIVFIVALVITVVVLRRYKKRKGNKTQMNENDVSLNSYNYFYLKKIHQSVSNNTEHSSRRGEVPLNVCFQALSLNPSQPQSGPETSQDTTDPEDGVSYASISFTKKTNSKVQVQNQVEEDEAVMYSTVKVSSASTRASIDLSSLYAAINKRQK